MGRTRLPFESRFVFPVFSKHEKSEVYVGLVKIVVDAAGFTARGDQQAFQHLANARSLARFCTNVRDHGENSVHEWSLGMNILTLNQLENIAVHYEREDTQQEYQAHLDESLFYGDA